ncbi:N-acetylmuramoyl-L-alanine amidase family protein [Leptothermofonsia sichuanensis]|uniref:N-acetylmuramoyl-L-alanine amidase family protein n=1 Tax=Leptothermofonsia sichuanensis TaxID=2917832 RepID=UPI0024C09473|nr:N-acetylmuramoyl-L-alanine amidase [Leptothermofonsia sichuanensis]
MTVPNNSVPERIEPAPTAPVFSPHPTNLLPQQRPIVVIDPGHGGPDPGEVGIGEIYEKDIVLDISLQVASLLENQGIQAILTRQTDVDLGL